MGNGGKCACQIEHIIFYTLFGFNKHNRFTYNILICMVRVLTCCQVDLSWNKYAEPNFKYYDEMLVRNCRDEEKVRQNVLILKVLLLCYVALF